MKEDYMPEDCEVAIVVKLNKQGEVVSVTDNEGNLAKFLPSKAGSPKVEILHCEPSTTLIVRENPCWAWYCTSRGCWLMQVPCQ